MITRATVSKNGEVSIQVEVLLTGITSSMQWKGW